MSKTSWIALLVSFLLSLSGCGHGHGHNHGDGSHSDHGTAPESHDSDLQLKLDNGERWQVDPPTRESATRLAQLLAATEKIQSVEDARALGKALDTELDTLVRGCKMTGTAHDQLHVFLVALFPQVEALQEKTSIEDLQLAHGRVGELLAAYAMHFE